MNMQSQIAPLSIDIAIQRANQWQTVAKPIIAAMFALDDAACDVRQSTDRRTGEEARGYIMAAYERMKGMLDGIREEHRCDHCMELRSEMTEPEGDAVEAFNDTLDAGMMTVAALVAQMEQGA